MAIRGLRELSIKEPVKDIYRQNSKLDQFHAFVANHPDLNELTFRCRSLLRSDFFFGRPYLSSFQEAAEAQSLLDCITWLIATTTRMKSSSKTGFTKAAILIDSQAAIKALRTRAAGPGSTLVREFYRKIGMLKRKRRTLQVKVVWVPGHLGVTGNENADREAKKAAMGENTGIFDKDRKSLLKKKLQSSKAAVVERMTKRIKKQHIDE